MHAGGNRPLTSLCACWSTELLSEILLLFSNTIQPLYKCVVFVYIHVEAHTRVLILLFALLYRNFKLSPPSPGYLFR